MRLTLGQLKRIIKEAIIKENEETKKVWVLWDMNYSTGSNPFQGSLGPIHGVFSNRDDAESTKNFKQSQEQYSQLKLGIYETTLDKKITDAERREEQLRWKRPKTYDW